MDTYVGLFYPYIHFRDEAWLKSTLLYWDRMQRITPPIDPPGPGDSDAVQTLEDAGFVENVDPSEEASKIGQLFLDLVEREGDRLVSRYGIEGDSLAQFEPPPEQGPSSTPQDRLTFIYGGKIDPELIQRLVESKLALWGSHDDIGVHPRLAAAYFTALAEKIGVHQGSYPVTQEPSFHVALSCVTMEELAASLLEEPALLVESSSDREVRQQMATLAFRTVLPADIDQIPLARMLKFWTKHAEARRTFQDKVKELVQALGEIEPEIELAALERHLEDHYQSTLRPELERLERNLNRAGLNTVSGTIGATLPAAAVALIGAPPAGIAIAITGAAIGVWNVFRARSQAHDQAPTAAAYLYHLKSDLDAQNLAGRVARAGRRLMGRS